MSVRNAGRACALVLAMLALVFAGSGCEPPKPGEAAQALKTGQALEKSGDTAGALKAYAEAAHADPQGPTAPESLLRWGDLSMRTGHPDQAVQAYTALGRMTHPTQVKLPEGTVRVPQDIPPRLDRAKEALDRFNATYPANDPQAIVFRYLPYRIMDTLVSMTGRHPAFSYWIAIFVFTVVIKLVLTPLTIGQLRSSRKMMMLQPRLKEIQDRFRDRPDELNRRMLALYKEEGVNPLGCGSGMVLQMVIMFALYRVILVYQYQFVQGHFLWIGSGLARMFPGTIAANLSQSDMPLLIIYAISMFVQSRLTLVPSMDEQQAQQQKMMATMMPLMLLFVLRSFPAAFALYWLLFNVMTTIQQLHITKKIDAEMAARKGGDGPTDEGSGPRRSDLPGPSKGSRDGLSKGSGDGPSNGGIRPKRPASPGPKKGPASGPKKTNRRKYAGS